MDSSLGASIHTRLSNWKKITFKFSQMIVSYKFKSTILCLISEISFSINTFSLFKPTIFLETFFASSKIKGFLIPSPRGIPSQFAFEFWWYFYRELRIKFAKFRLGNKSCEGNYAEETLAKHRREFRGEEWFSPNN